MSDQNLNIRQRLSEYSESDFLTQLHSNQLLIVNSRKRNGLIIYKQNRAEFVGPGAAVGGSLDNDCSRVIPVGNSSLVVPNSEEESLKANLIRRQWIRLTRQIADNPVPLQRAQMILNQFEKYFGSEEVAKIPDEAFALLVGVLPQTISEVRHTTPAELKVKSDSISSSSSEQYHLEKLRHSLEQLFKQSEPDTPLWTNNLVEDELPLLGLFTCLREAGLPLGINEYFLVLKALQKGFGTANRDSLADLCRTLWVKSKDEEHLFNYHFEQVMQTAPSSSSRSPIAAEQESLPGLPAPNVKQEVQEESKAEELPAPATSTAISQELMEVEDEIQVAEAVQIATRSEGEVVTNRFTQSDEYFPVTRRQMKQNWRYLRRMVREGPLVEIDIEATIARFSQQGIPSDPVLVPGRINRTELLLLIDHKGSMVPFHALAQRLAETAQRGGRLGEAGVFYFHNCPTQYLYRDPSRQQAELVSNLLMKLRPERSVVLIFSDGGSARGGFNPQRLELTHQFLDRLKERVRYVTWLNPMSKERWAGTTAGEIAQHVPMFEMSRRGMEGAIDVLRGRSLQVIG